MGHKTTIIAIVMTMMAIFIGIAICMATAQEAPPSIPGDAFGSGGGGGGGGGSGGSFSAPTYQPFTAPLKSSDGTVIGQLVGKNFNSVLVGAEKNGSAGNLSYDLRVTGELSSKPPDNCWLDINFLGPEAAALPPGMENGQVLGVFNITRSTDGWGYTGGSPKYTLKISGLAGSINAGDPYILVRSDGSGYQIIRVTLDVSGDGQVTVGFNPPGDMGTFTIMRAMAATQTPVATPTPTPITPPTATPMPAPDNGLTGVPILLGLFAVGALVGAMVILGAFFLFVRNR